MTVVTPVLLAGGSGSRLWPLSRKSFPKQFSKIFKNESLFQRTVRRFSTSQSLTYASTLTITNESFRFIVKEQLQTLGIKPGAIIIEPEIKNTGPAVLAATIYAEKRSKDSILFVVPSDHVIPDTAALHSAVKLGLPELQKGNIVTFGINPTRPETGYGYLELQDTISNGPTKLSQFIEKPNIATAKAMIKSNNFLWNSGMFLFRAADLIDGFKMYAPEILAAVTDSVVDGDADLGFWRLNAQHWKKSKSVSLDIALMEKTNNLVVIPFNTKWSDLGSWHSIWEESEKDEYGVVSSGRTTAINCKNVMLRSESDAQELVGIGLKDIVAVSMPDAVLVAHKNHTQDVKEVVSALKKKDAHQADIFPKEHRPWGWFEILTRGNRFQVKRILVKPGAALSLQSHKYRAEQWVVVEGIIEATVNKNVSKLIEGQSIEIPIGAIHRMQNSSELPALLIEVQTGIYLGEDDIVRYEDIYARKNSNVSGPKT